MGLTGSIETIFFPSGALNAENAPEGERVPNPRAELLEQPLRETPAGPFGSSPRPRFFTRPLVPSAGPGGRSGVRAVPHCKIRLSLRMRDGALTPYFLDRRASFRRATRDSVVNGAEQNLKQETPLR